MGPINISSRFGVRRKTAISSPYEAGRAREDAANTRERRGKQRSVWVVHVRDSDLERHLVAWIPLLPSCLSTVKVTQVYPSTLSFLKVGVTPLCFGERPTWFPVFSNGEKSKRNFHFYEKRPKGKITFSVCFAEDVLKVACALSSGTVAPPSFFPWKTSLASQHQADIALDQVYEPLCFILSPFILCIQ